MPDESPEWAALLLATEANHKARGIRSGLGGYVPLNHPGHPSKWSRIRRDALAEAESTLQDTIEALRVATDAHLNRMIEPPV